MQKPNSLLMSYLYICILLLVAPLPKSTILSQDAGFENTFTTVTIVRPPLVAILKVRDPASRYFELERANQLWPLPFGPPLGLYVGGFPTAALERVDTDANEDFHVIKEMNLEQAVVEYGPIKFPPV